MHQADILLGVDTEYAPMPAIFTTRTQFVDLCHKLLSAMHLQPNAELEHRTVENSAWKSASLESFYPDLSADSFGHLEVCSSNLQLKLTASCSH